MTATLTSAERKHLRSALIKIIAQLGGEPAAPAQPGGAEPRPSPWRAGAPLTALTWCLLPRPRGKRHHVDGSSDGSSLTDRR